MTDGYLNEYISQRMQELGFKEFHWEPVLIPVTAGVIKFIGAYNEFFYLVTRTLTNGTIIIGDTHYLVAQDYANLTFARLHEFTGNITIDSPANASIEFIRVIPQL